MSLSDHDLDRIDVVCARRLPLDESPETYDDIAALVAEVRSLRTVLADADRAYRDLDEEFQFMSAYGVQAHARKYPAEVSNDG